jgi:phosphinothricin acetyltransferase
MSLIIRPAQPDNACDIAGITAIYNDAVVNTTAIWDEAESTLDDRRLWIAERQAQGFPFLVAVDGDNVRGYATFAGFRARSGYRYTVEHSVYVASDQQRRGIAAALMPPLIEEAKLRKLHAMIGGIEAENMASIRLHEHFGFTEVGRLPQVGRKFDRWLDLVFMQKTLSETA